MLYFPLQFNEKNLMPERTGAIVINNDGNVGLSPNALKNPNMRAIKIPEEPEIELPSIKDLDPLLAHQLEFTLSSYGDILPAEQLDHLRTFSERYVTSRHLRGAELETPELQTAREQKRAFHGEENHFFMVTCIDGRNIPTIMFTFIPRSEGGFIRTQAGDLAAFKQQFNSDEVRLDKNSDFYTRLKEILTKYPGESIYYGLDSHVGCAARGGMADAGGSTAQDGGLYEDVARKKKIAAELQRIGEELKSAGEPVATIIPDLFSFDPHKGTIIMGLKRYINDVDPEVGFSEEIREQLAQDGKIIDTWILLNDPIIVAELELHAPHRADFRSDYSGSVARNWQALTDLYNEGNGAVYRILKEKLHAIYDADGTLEEVLDHKAKLLMKNLVTRWSIGRNEPEWEFDTHQERVIAITERAYGPFIGNIDHFLVSSFEGDAEVLDNIQTANGLIRRFRRDRSIPDSSSDVLLIDNQAVIKDLIPNATPQEVETEWIKLQSVSCSIFSHIDWDNSAIQHYEPQHLRQIWYTALERARNEGFSIDSVAANKVFNGIWEVFNRMRAMLGHSAFSDHLKRGKTVVLNSIMDQNGRPRIIVPLIPHTNGSHPTLVQS
ncbi:MAG: hypothetical protein UZ22_OP11002000316 [Microgenomates bacterium OLB23]|nr:MAG: hypothetical protein UZ22_OP11002000316 [Microgenomates bacterium OLB23]